MAPNNGLANSKPKNGTRHGVSSAAASATTGKSNQESSGTTGTTTILPKGTVEARGMGTHIHSRKVISNQIQQFIKGEGKFGFWAEVRGFFTVWTFVTRLPGPTWVDHHPGT